MRSEGLDDKEISHVAKIRKNPPGTRHRRVLFMTTRGIEPVLESCQGFHYRYAEVPVDVRGIHTVRNDLSQSNSIVIDRYERCVYPERRLGLRHNDSGILDRIPTRVQFPVLS